MKHYIDGGNNMTRKEYVKGIENTLPTLTTNQIIFLYTLIDEIFGVEEPLHMVLD